MTLRPWLGVALVAIACGGDDDGASSLRGAQPDASDSVDGSAAGRGGGLPGCAEGEETCPCYGNGTCNEGLTCASDICVNFGGGGSSSGSGGFGTGGNLTGGHVGSGGNPGIGGAGQGAGGGGACISEGALCSASQDACCIGLTCVHDVRSPRNQSCARLCSTSGECPSGCCTPLEDGSGSVCAPPQYCASACRPAGRTCTDDDGSCCSDSICVRDSDVGSAATCSAMCSVGADCLSDCCAPLQQGGQVCSDPSYCAPSCLPAGSSCVSGEPCCYTSLCISDAFGTACQLICTSDFECSTGCCALVPSFGLSTCSHPSYCR